MDLVQRLEHIGNISVASVRRPAKFGKNRSSCAGDIKDLSESKMAAQPPFWIYSLQNLVEIGEVVPEILKILTNPRWRLCSHFGSSSNVKTHREHIYNLIATT